MKRFLMCLAILGLAAPVLADPTATGTNTVPAGAPVTYVYYDAVTGDISYSDTPRTGDPAAKQWQYNDTGDSGYFFGGPGQFVGDDIHELMVNPWGGGMGLWPSTITEITFGAYLYTVHPQTAWSAAVLLLDNPGGADTPGLAGATLTFITGVGPLGRGVSIVTISGLKIPKPSPDMWFLVDYSGAPDAGTISGAGPLITGPAWYGPPPSKNIGYSHNYFWMAGSLYFFGGNPWADFYHEIRGVPEPVTIGFLAVGGLLALRRRRA